MSPQKYNLRGGPRSAWTPATIRVEGEITDFALSCPNANQLYPLHGFVLSSQKGPTALTNPSGADCITLMSLGQVGDFQADIGVAVIGPPANVDFEFVFCRNGEEGFSLFVETRPLTPVSLFRTRTLENQGHGDHYEIWYRSTIPGATGTARYVTAQIKRTNLD